MTETIYQIDYSLVPPHERPALRRRIEELDVLVPVEPDIALLPEDSANECASGTVLKGGANYCIRPRDHEGMHMAVTLWSAGIGDNDGR